jgi:Cache domain
VEAQVWRPETQPTRLVAGRLHPKGALVPFDVHISLQKLLTGLIVVIAPLSVVGLYLTSNSDTNLQQNVGAHFRTIAQADSALASQFFGEVLINVSAVAAEGRVLDAIAAANRSNERTSAEAVAARSQKAEREWDTPEGDSLVKEVLSSPVSGWLQHHRTLNPRMLKIIVADENGAAIAATDKPVTYTQGDKESWQTIALGKGSVHVTDVRYDERNRLNYVEIDVPVLEESSGRFIGAVSALVDISGLFSILNRQHVGRTGRILLVKDDGTVVSGPNVTPELKLKADEFPAVHDALGTLEGRETGFVAAALKSENRIVGFADVGLKHSYPNLSWLILVSQEEQEALAPVRSLGHFALLMVVLGLLMLTLLLAYFSMHRQQELTAVEVLPSHASGQGRASA